MNYNIPDLTGKTAIITGGNSGLGLKTALELARNHANVVITCRSPQKGEEAVREVKKDLPNAAIGYGLCDFSDLASVKAFVDKYKTEHKKLDILVASAGVSTIIAEGGHKLTKDNEEILMQANHLGHFALIHGLFPLLLAAEAPRVASCNTSFLATEFMAKPIDFDDLNWSKRASQGRYNVQQAYFASRIAQQQMTLKLNQKFQKALGENTKAAAVVFEPGLVKRAEPDKSIIMEYLRLPVEQGCRTHLKAATDPSVKPNDFLEPHRFVFIGPPIAWTLGTSKKASDQTAMDKLWEVSQDIVKRAWETTN